MNDLEFDFGLDEVALDDHADFDFGEPAPDKEENEIIAIGPQKGPQTAFLTTSADIAIYGGAAGGGKSYALLLEPLRHFNNPRFGGVIFRRNSKQVRNEGGLWHESMKMYGPLGAIPREGLLDWKFESGMRMGFGHLEFDRSVHDWHGSQIPFIGFDELTHFTRYQFFYMLSRNRSDSGVPGYMRATCNPDVDSWVRKFIDWWIDKDGWAIQSRSGVLRWFVQIEDNLKWGDSPKELTDQFGPAVMPTSVTFIPSTIYDNQKLLKADPTYLARLMALPKVERMRLLGDERGGNWNVRHAAGSLFRREWFQMVDAIPSGWVTAVRFWDRAATKVSPQSPDPDWTRGLRLLRYPDNTFLIADLKSTRDTPHEVEKLVKSVAQHDSPTTRIMSQRDPGSAGVSEGDNFIRMLAGYDVKVEPMFKNKLARAIPVSAQVQAGNIYILRAPWNDDFFDEVEGFPEGNHDDIVDVLSGAFNELSIGLSILDVL